MRVITEEHRKNLSLSHLGNFPSEETKRKMSESHKRNKNYPWKENPGYTAKHYRIRKQFGKASQCEHCETTLAKKYEWANKDHQYKLNREDWMQLCTSCHRLYDLEKGNIRK